MTPARIMIVEDEKITAAHLQEILSELGYTVTAAVASAADAIREAERTSPDLVLMDVHIEGNMDGVDAARIIRERFQIPAVYLTAHADSGTLDRAKKAEPLGYIVKPFQESELQASIEMALHKSRVDQAKREREDRLAATLGSVGEGVIAMDETGRITFLNRAAEEWTGWKQPEALGRTAEEVVRIMEGKTRAPVDNLLRRAARQRTPAELESGALLLSRHGAEHAIAGSAAPIRDHNGHPSGAVLVFGSAKAEAPAASQAAPAERDGAPQTPAPFEIVFESEAMRQIMNFIRRVAASEASTILLEGESGTGKDVLAKYLHYNSRRDAEPFIAINCAAIPETLLESELFGYEKGAFTDARAQKKGILELGNGGTVFLDEIGEMPLLLQAKLLRVLEEQSFRRLGGVKDIQLDLRVIAATNRSLSDSVKQGTFRVDLYYRLNVIQVVVPPLRERKDDILPLANHFVRFYNQKFHRNIKGISPKASEALRAHDWPGNVRELRNTIERAMILEETPSLQSSSLGIGLNSLEMAQPEAAGASDVKKLDSMSLEEVERTTLIRALERAKGNQTHAARLLNITRDTLRYKIKKYNLGAPGAPPS